MNTQHDIAEVSLVYRSKIKASERLKVRWSKDAYDLFIESWDLYTIEHIEEYKMLLMNHVNMMIGIMTVSKGGISSTITDVSIILHAAIKNKCIWD